MVDLEPVVEADDIAFLKAAIERHLKFTGSAKAARLLADWSANVKKFVKVFPKDFRKVVEQRKQATKGAVAAAAS